MTSLMENMGEGKIRFSKYGFATSYLSVSSFLTRKRLKSFKYKKEKMIDRLRKRDPGFFVFFLSEA